MRTLGFALDALLLGLAGYWTLSNPAVIEIRRVGLVKFVTSLPTPLPPNNATGLLIDLNAQHGVVDASTAVQLQQWYNYLLDEDRGSLAVSNPETAYFHEANLWKNSLILPAVFTESVPHFMACWFRNMLAGWALYYGVGGLWGLWMYVIRSQHFFPQGDETKPTWEDIGIHLRVSTAAMVFYTLAPTVGEWMMERGFTLAYHSLGAVNGWSGYILWLVVYMTFVEWGIYWIHRLMHDIRPLYDYLHRVHHIYNNRHSLSPFAGLAFHPVDGLAQASPYLIGMLIMPVHMWTHEALLFFTSIWTTNIHDTLTGDTEPVMGSAYHTIHHTTYKNNYGQIFTLFDYLHDTLAPPAHIRKEWGWNTPTGRDYHVDYATLGDHAKKTQ